MKKILLLSVVAVFLFACNSPSGSSSDGDKKENKSEGKSSTSGLYIKYKLTENNMSVYNSMYYSEGGKEQAMIMEVEVLGRSMKNHILRKDGYVYAYAEGEKNGSKFKDDGKYEDFLFNITQKIEEEGGKKVGTDQVLGKECIVYEVADEKGSSDVSKFSVWDDVVLKLVKNGEVKMEAVEVEKGKNIPASVFEVPKDVNFAERQTPDTDDSDFNEEGAKG